MGVAPGCLAGPVTALPLTVGLVGCEVLLLAGSLCRLRIVAKSLRHFIFLGICFAARLFDEERNLGIG